MKYLVLLPLWPQWLANIWVAFTRRGNWLYWFRYLVQSCLFTKDVHKVLFPWIQSGQITAGRSQFPSLPLQPILSPKEPCLCSLSRPQSWWPLIFSVGFSCFLTAFLSVTQLPPINAPTFQSVLREILLPTWLFCWSALHVAYCLGQWLPLSPAILLHEGS